MPSIPGLSPLATAIFFFIFTAGSALGVAIRWAVNNILKPHLEQKSKLAQQELDEMKRSNDIKAENQLVQNQFMRDVPVLFKAQELVVQASTKQVIEHAEENTGKILAEVTGQRIVVLTKQLEAREKLASQPGG
jgi:p-aminobenzoyl-glutamate transporter AbgT